MSFNVIITAGNAEELKEILVALCSQFGVGVLNALAANPKTRVPRKEKTERVKALENELARMGIQTESTHDTLIIYGGNPKAAAIDTYGDHRMAMSFAVAGTQLAGMEINDSSVVSKTFPDFWEKLASIGVGVDEI